MLGQGERDLAGNIRFKCVVEGDMLELQRILLLLSNFLGCCQVACICRRISIID